MSAVNLNTVLNHVKQCFVGKDEIIDMLGIALVARENAFLLGPPGTAKSIIVRTLAQSLENAKNFEYLLTRFTEPNEIFGPFDIRKLKEGDLVTNTEGMMPEASLVFLDEIFNANSAILNSLLMALNERIFKRGKETKKLPALMFVGASNNLPEDETLNALLDRFLVRIKCDYVAPNLLEEVLIAGWKLDMLDNTQNIPQISPTEIEQLQQRAKQVDLSPIRKNYLSLIHQLRNTGIKISDRRAVKIQYLIAASATLCDRSEAITSDLWVMKYIWDNEEQIEILAGMIDTLIQQETHEKSHPQALKNSAPNAELLMQEVTNLQQKWDNPNLTFEEQNIIKDSLRYLQTRSHWLKNVEHKQHIQQNIEQLWHKILQTT